MVLTVAVPGASASAQAEPPALFISISPTVAGAAASATGPLPAVLVEIPAGDATAASTAPLPVLIILPPAGQATADMGPINPYNTIGEYLRAAYAELLVVQVLIEADIATAVAAQDVPVRDEAHSRLSACLLAQREVLRAIALDDKREPYEFVRPSNGAASAQGAPPVVTS